MKKQSTGIFTQMSPTQLESLITIVDETLAANLYQPKRKIFTAADLWNIQRGASYSTSGRYSL